MTVMAKLTKTQSDALTKIREAGVWYAYDGISAATIRVLEREGLIDVRWSTSSRYVYSTRRTHYQREWVATPKKGTAK